MLKFHEWLSENENGTVYYQSISTKLYGDFEDIEMVMRFFNIFDIKKKEEVVIVNQVFLSSERKTWSRDPILFNILLKWDDEDKLYLEKEYRESVNRNGKHNFWFYTKPFPIVCETRRTDINPRTGNKERYIENPIQYFIPLKEARRILHENRGKLLTKKLGI